ncbi:SDR family oxidoreductase [Listeria sp. PSOL-1]|uniref:SDR family NAD(P)-dependent oxidoreductase n=1 Tax=Listeria sp. PSOL-1 TaxID=1844999 RepID=UPI0013D23CDF|nr:SDR family oxidoreductase [Listeria sp. PSOL-1]
MNTFVEGKYVLITGASSGLGKEIAFEVARLRGVPILLSRSSEKLAAISEEIRQVYGIDVPYYRFDVTDFEQMEALIAQITDKYSLSVLINCAGFGLFELAVDTPFAVTEKMFQTNVLGLIKLTQLILPELNKRKQAHIVNIASQAGKIATPKSAVYSATKFAVLGYSNALRMEISSKKIYLTCINPGPIRTNFFNTADKSGDYLEKVNHFVLSPNKVARKTVAILGKKRRELNLPFSMNIVSRLYQVMPQVIEFLGKNAFLKK